MSNSADAEITAAYIDGLTDAMATTAFLLGNEQQINALIRALTDLACDPARHPKRREILRVIGMQLHDHRTRNAEWKSELLTPDHISSVVGPV